MLMGAGFFSSSASQALKNGFSFIAAVETANCARWDLVGSRRLLWQKPEKERTTRDDF
jgi:hypothetical protein